jgi:hypothetical protein
MICEIKKLMTLNYKTNFTGDMNSFMEKFFRLLENDLVMQLYSFQKRENILVFLGKSSSEGASSTVSKLKPHFFNKGKIWIKQGKHDLVVKIKFNFFSFFVASLVVSIITGILTMWLSEEGWIIFLKGFTIALLAINFAGYKILKFRADRLIHPNIFTALQLLEKKNDIL